MAKFKKPEVTVVGAEGCKCDNCKKPQDRFSFCTNHYEWFKFGLITKEGKKVADFEKKFDHYTAFLEKQKTYKVA